jgi:hypothetical protein
MEFFFAVAHVRAVRPKNPGGLLRRVLTDPACAGVITGDDEDAGASLRKSLRYKVQDDRARVALDRSRFSAPE